MRRRAFLSNAGAVMITFAGGNVWRAWAHEDPEFGASPAFEPWRTWRADAHEGPLAMIHAAILASNAYNTQPWLFKVSERRIELYADRARHLGAFDPYLRELHFSLGCALENLLVSAAGNGYHTSLSFPPGKLETSVGRLRRALVTRVDLSRGGAGRPSELYEAIPHRHTNRTPFDVSRAVPQSVLDMLRALERDEVDVKLFVYTADDERNRIADLIFEATQTINSDPDVRRDTARWLRRTMAEVEAHRDGPFIGASSAANAAANPGSYVDMMKSARLFGLIAVRDRYDRVQTLRAGRLWQRAHLLATARGLAARPANGAVELIDHEKYLGRDAAAAVRLALITGDSSWQPTFMFYMGYATAAATASSRRAVKEVLI
jgi:hypothetical protein